mmetsp:Transcript_2792/g.8024  ORF Transcript_2792/g.8024 Transcript_2792/m.8024 type:complete len:214 (+) Transcript_2792:1091-1732(+)
MPLLGSLPLKKSLSSCCTLGMRVEPPINTTSSTTDLSMPASESTLATGPSVFLKRSALSSSKRARVSVSCMSMPWQSASSSTDPEVCVLSVRLRFSHADLSRCTARLSPDMSTPFLRLNCAIRCCIIRWSKSSPPRCVSPSVAFTSNTPSSMVRRVTSKVPPPRSKTRMFFSPSFLSRPYAIAAAVGSLMMRITLRPEMVPASLVAWRWASLK